MDEKISNNVTELMIDPSLWIMIFHHLNTKELYSNVILACKYFSKILVTCRNEILLNREEDRMVFELVNAIINKNIMKVSELCSIMKKKPSNLCDIAVNTKDDLLPILDRLIKNSFQCKKTVSITAVNRGKINTIRYLCQNNFPISKKAFRKAIDTNSLEMCISFGRKNIGLANEHKNIFKPNFERSRDYRNYIKMVRSGEIPPKIGVCAYASLRGRLEILKYLRYYGYCWNHNAYIMAIIGNHIEIIKYLFTMMCPLDVSVFVIAAYYGNLEIIKFLHQINCPWNSLVCAYASYGGHINILKHLRENGCPWDCKSCKLATIGNNVAILKYLHDNGCHWENERIYNQAYKRGFKEIIDYYPKFRSINVSHHCYENN